MKMMTDDYFGDEKPHNEPLVDEDQLREKLNRAKHPTPEQMFIHEAAKTLTQRQKEVWELANYGQLTQNEIGQVLQMTQQRVSKTLRVIENKIKRYVKAHLSVYKLIKAEYYSD